MLQNIDEILAIFKLYKKELQSKPQKENIQLSANQPVEKKE